MEATFEALEGTVGVVRVHTEGGKGTEWEWACTGQIVGDTMFLHGGISLSFEQAREIRELARKMGLKQIEYERRNVTHPKRVVFKIKR